MATTSSTPWDTLGEDMQSLILTAVWAKLVRVEVPPASPCPFGIPGALLQCRGARDASEGKGPQRRLGRRLEEVAKAVGGGYCRLQMPLKPALGVSETGARHRLGALEGGGGGYLPPFQCTPCEGAGVAAIHM